MRELYLKLGACTLLHVDLYKIFKNKKQKKITDINFICHKLILSL